MGFKLWATNELLTSSDLNTYLAKQVIVVCTSGTHPSSPPTGMHIYETDSKTLLKWNGGAWEPVTGTRGTYTPSLTAATTNPTLGTGSVAQGWWNWEPGSSISLNFFIKFGTSGLNPGSGTYSVSLPPGITSSNVYGTGHVAVGSIQIADSSSGAFQPGSVFVPPSSTTLGLVGTAPVSNSSPWTWAAGDYLSGSAIIPI